MQFKDIPGHQALKHQLATLIQRGRIPHAQLFVGAEGSANLALALAVAQRLQCEQPEEYDSCGSCSSCHKYKKIIHPDLHFVFPIVKTPQVSSKPTSEEFIKEWRSFLLTHQFPSLSDWLEAIGAENKQANIPVEESRRVIRTLALKTYESQYKVMIIWLPELMRGPAANALLKILEEPPAFTIFLLVAHDEKQLLTTIRSRVQLVQVPPFSDKDIEAYLTQHNLQNLGTDRIKEAAYLADGNMHLALQLMQNTDDSVFVFFRDWFREIYKIDIAALVKRGDEFNTAKKEMQKAVFEYGMGIFREVLLFHSQSTDILRQSGAQLKFIEGLSKTLEITCLEDLFGYFNEALHHLERNANLKILFLDVSLKVSQLLKR